MLDILKTWNGQITINDVTYDSAESVSELPKQPLHIVLGKKVDNANKAVKTAIESVSDKQEYRFTVKGYMCKEATPEFDFMLKWNNNVPMPMRTMVGTIEKETRGMVYAKLHGEGRPVITCMCCGKELTNPISRHYGIGPVCLSKVGIPFDIEDIDNIKEALVKIEWTGWIIRSAIIDKTPIE